MKPITFPTFGRCAESPCFRLTFGRCAEASLHRERSVSVFLLPLHLSHLRKVCRIPAFSPHLRKVCRIPAFSPHLRKVRRSVTASRALCIRVSSPPAPSPPSEGVQNSRVFASPSEGAQKRHCVESALYPCFFFPCTFPTFGRWKVSLICWGISWCNILRIIFLSECAKYRQKNGVEWGSGNMAFISRD